MAQRGEERYLWKQDRWNGGLSDDSKTGIPGSFRYGIGLDIRYDSGLMRLAKRAVADDAGQILDTIKWIEVDPATLNSFYYGEDAIYKESLGIYTIIHNLSLSTDSPNGQGLCDFNGSLFYRQATQLGRHDYDVTWDDDWQTGLESCISWSPMERFLNLLLVGHGRYVGTVDDVFTWVPRRLTLPPGYNVRDIFRAGSFAVILATRGFAITDSEEGYMFLWDGTSEKYNDAIPLSGNPHAGISYNNTIVLFAGQQAEIQESLGGIAQVVQTLPKIGDNKTAEVWPGSVEFWNKMVHFGISDGSSTTIPRAIYNWGKKKSLFPDVLNAEYPASHGVLTGTGIQITAAKKIGTTLRFAWKNGSDVGVDKINMSLFQSTGTFRSLSFDRLSPYDKIAVRLKAELAGALVLGDTVSAKVSGDPYGDENFSNATTYVTGSVSTAGEKKLELPIVVNDTPIRSPDLHTELTLTSGNGQTSPVIKRAWLDTIEDADIL